MDHESRLLQASVVCLLAMVVLVPLAKRLQLGAVLGYLIGGVLIGPGVLGLIDQAGSILRISELGVVMLMFIIGLELSPKRLWLMRHAVFGAGLAQVLLCGAAIGGVAIAFFQQHWTSALVLGLGLALSSTAFVLQLLAERRELHMPHGRLAFSVLLFQDIAAIPLMALVPLLSGVSQPDSGEDPLVELLKVVACVGGLIVGGRYLLRPLFRIVAKGDLQDILTATALLVVMGSALLMELIGVSMALGAFLAGVLLAESEYRHALEAKIEPFKGMLLGLFFLGVGMNINLGLLVDSFWTVLGLALLLILLKLPLVALVGRFPGRLQPDSALRLGVVLAGGGEFAFVIFSIARRHGLFDAGLHDLLVLTITLSMALTPLVVMLLSLFAKPVRQSAAPEQEKPLIEHEPRVIIMGMGRVGQVVARLLHAQRVPFVAFDTAVETVEFNRKISNLPIYYGNPLRLEILHAAKAEHAQFFVIATDDGQANIDTARLVRQRYPHMTVITRALDWEQLHTLLDLDAGPVRETFFSSLEMGRQVLLGLGLNEQQIAARIERFRRHDEEMLRELHKVASDEAASLRTTHAYYDDLEGLFARDVLEEPIAPKEP
ncbi:glutathione-regulated potassium-efflux system protein KefB [Azotobacter beijerinckii]|uniref:Glutathione-regulated potassium-efflux system protein KefB n=1 Tax=Azotobacter beijerinckii TaxID=170623 RepID=A0A1H9FQC8_9GAMM|nr:monovalent cation:proton antiporter-2 (CPA2) family protein [Azotobacter beijerinckii]SEQ39618.1 glutathione-regulated potassium-efflux system protein KefB [Azotobacter beijerinckii]